MFQESLSSNAPSLESSLADAALATATSDQLKCHTLYHLHVCLRNGRELVARDSGGTSDPYVKFYWRGKQVFKSKTIDKDLNPVWDESFILAIDDPFVPLEIKVGFFIHYLSICSSQFSLVASSGLPYRLYHCTYKTRLKGL